MGGGGDVTANAVAGRAAGRQTGRRWRPGPDDPMRLIPQLSAAALALLVLGAASPAPIDLARLAGVYKVGFTNSLVTGETYRSENILEIVETGPGAAYIRTELEFFNGHSCSLWGIGHVEGAALVYRSKQEPYTPGDPPCVLRVFTKGGKVILDDDGTCQAWCGARGTLSGIDFPLSKRRPIRYMASLKASREYAQAVAEDAAR